MSKLNKIFEELNISKDKIKSIINTLRENPLMAMEKINALGLAPETIQAIINIVMTDPTALDELTKKVGLSDEELDIIKKQLD